MLRLIHGAGARREGVLLGVGVDLGHSRNRRGRRVGRGRTGPLLVRLLLLLRTAAGLQAAGEAGRSRNSVVLASLSGGLVEVDIGRSTC